MIEMGKEYRTRDGKQVVILATNGRGLCPVVGQILNESEEWEHNAWTADGFYYPTRSFSSSDLIEVKPARVFDGWINIYEKSSPDDSFLGTAYATRMAADKGATQRRIACIHIRQEYKEGEGL